MSKEYLEAKDLQANFITCFNELLTKTDKDILVVNISREMAQDMVNLYEKYLTINPSEALEELFKTTYFGSKEEYDKINNCYNSIKQYILKSQEQEKENELLKEIIKSFFDRGCPLHQYINSKGELMIEVDDECSTMILGEYKGVDLDKKLKEVLECQKYLKH